MRPAELTTESFAAYAPEARGLAVEYLSVLKRMPLGLLSAVLRQIIQYDWSFPAERRQLVSQLKLLGDMDISSFEKLMSAFAKIPLSRELEKLDWVDHPQQFSEQLTTYLWANHLSDGYHNAAQSYQQFLQSKLLETRPSAPRWTIVVVGRGSERTERPLFRQLVPRGLLFTGVKPDGGMEMLAGAISDRAAAYPSAYEHWYIDGGEPYAALSQDKAITTMSYQGLVAATTRELALLQEFAGRKSGGKNSVGPEAVGSYITGLSPQDLGIKGDDFDAPLRHFEVSIITQGAGCQIFSTTFVQWAARECLHRAQPMTLLVRFSTRQRNAPMEQLLARDPLRQLQDAEGSLIDADMGAYYTWINQSRLAGADEARFLVWFEGQSLACAISPAMPKGKTFNGAVSVKQILDQLA